MQKGYNANEMKRRNKQKLLELIRMSSRSRAELARESGLTRAAISVLIDGMIEEGLLLDGEWIDGGRGRKTIGLKLNGEKYNILSVNIARDICSVGLADFAGNISRILRMETMNCGTSQDAALGQIGSMMDELLKEIPEGKLLGIGISAPGPLDSERGELLTPTHFELWHHAPIVQWFRQKYQCPVYLENIAKSLALAEKYYGIGSSYRNYIEILVDTGVGSGILLDGRLYRGVTGFAGEVGHMSVNFAGKRCACGNRGCLEMYASIPNLLAYGEEEGISCSSWKLLVNRAKSDDGARRLYERELELLAGAFTDVVNFMDLEAIILSGDLLYEGERTAGELEKRVNQQFIGRESRHIAVLPSGLLENAQVLAGINLVLEHFNREMN